jgi:hypothetical protein
MGGILRCEYCGDVIGVYEPLILRTDNDARETSIAAEPDARSEPSGCHHRLCYQRVYGEDAWIRPARRLLSP